GSCTSLRTHTGRESDTVRKDRRGPLRGTRVASGSRQALQPLWTGLHPSARLLAPTLSPFPGPLLAPHFGNHIPDALRGDRGFLQGAPRRIWEPVAALGAPAALRCGIGEPGCHEAFVLQPVERNVDRTKGDLLRPGEFLNFGMDGDPVGVVVQGE